MASYLLMIFNLIIINYLSSDLNKIKLEEERHREELAKKSVNNDVSLKENDEKLIDDKKIGNGSQASEEELKKKIPSKRYKIQEVIKPNQVILVQVLKDERGLKGAHYLLLYQSQENILS